MTTTTITPDRVFAALDRDGSPLWFATITARLGIPVKSPQTREVYRALAVLQDAGHASLHHGSGWHRVLRPTLCLAQRDHDELARLLAEARAAAEGDSNDEEIEAWQAFGEAAAAIIGIVVTEDEAVSA